MKKFFILAIICLLFTSCKWTYVSFSDLSPVDYKNYINKCYSQSASPIQYSVVLGENPASDYDWLTIYVCYYIPKRFNYFVYQGNKDDLIKAAYPNADSILYFNGSYCIGTLKNKKEK